LVSMGKLETRVGEISQVAVVVKDLRKAMENYWKTLGIGPWSVYTFAPPALREPSIRGKPVPYSMRLALTKAGSVELELIEPLEGPSIYKEFLAKRGEGLHHLGFLVDDLDNALAAFKKMGIDVLMSGRWGDVSEYYYMDTEAVLGIIYEIIKRKRTRPPPEAVYPPKSESDSR